MDQVAPPSPAPSNDDIYQTSLHHLMRHNATTSYPREPYSPGTDSMGQRAPHSRYGSPRPHPGPRYDHPSPWPLRGHDSHAYQTSEYETTSAFYTPVHDVGHRPYSTPETSPPTPSRGSDVLTTRSGLTIQKGGTTIKPLATRAGRVEKSTPRKKERKGKAAKRVEDFGKPLSELAQEHPEVPVADIGAYVHRDSEERVREVAQSKTPGKIKRPMNAFMLYRKAYQNLAKSVCTQNNHQLVSQVCGNGWPLEPEQVREQFNEWAKIERMNHQLAHPGYKFTPSKPKPKTRGDEELRSDDGNLGDFDWASGRASSRSRQMKDPSSSRREAPQSIYQTYPTMANPALGLQPAMYHYGSPGKAPGDPGAHGALFPGQYYHQTVNRRQDVPGFVEDVVIARQSPALNYTGPPTDGKYETLGHYGQLSSQGELNPMVEPELADAIHYPYAFVDMGNEYADPGPEGHHPWPHVISPLDGRPELAEEMSMYGETCLDPQLQVLRGHDHSWKVEEVDSSHFNNWMDPPE